MTRLRSFNCLEKRSVIKRSASRCLRNIVSALLMLSVLMMMSAVQEVSAQMLQTVSIEQKRTEQFLHAARFDDLKSIKKLLEQGIDPNVAENDRGETALMLAVREDSYRVFEFLIFHPDINLDARAKNGDTAIMLAAYLGKVDWLSELIFAGAQINQPGWTALHYAAAIGDEQIIAVLLEHSAYIDAESPNKTTPLMMAARKGDLSPVRLLVQEGADLRFQNSQGMTALDFAQDAGMRVVAEYLLHKMQNQ